MIKQIYLENLVSRNDLMVRDTVIDRVKNSFFNAAKKDYPQLLDGEITVSGTGSAMNGLWTSQGSDIDVVVVFHNRMAHN
jgi:predicted nucleotidyltransferase|tara:strand:- start:184 stop:423 length:240 start_codon:yes stop_codon:yes gene_type:complete